MIELILLLIGGSCCSCFCLALVLAPFICLWNIISILGQAPAAALRP